MSLVPRAILKSMLELEFVEMENAERCCLPLESIVLSSRAITGLLKNKIRR